MEKLILSEEYSIYKSKYRGEYSIEEFLKYIEFNDKAAIHSNNNSVWIEIEAECFRSINSQVKEHIEQISGKKFINYAQHYWVYTQKKGFDLEWMHQHISVHPPGRSNLRTDYTFTFYLQIPDDLKGDQGHIVFQTEDGVKHKFLPQVGDIFIFPADIRHTGMPNPESDIKRIVYAGSLCIDIWNQNNKTTQLI